jgi:hypothetical protein
MKFIKLCAIALFFFLSTAGFSQTNSDPYTPDARLYQCLKKDYVDQMSAQRSELLLYYNYYINNSFYVVKLNQEKPVTGIDIHTVQTTKDVSATPVNFSEKTYNANTFNVMKYDFQRRQDGFVTYVWKEAGVALVFYPISHFQAAYSNYLKSLSEIK